ncbi:aminotransferase class I/II-fold pyridoxal phosphate-dependent enzyme [Actinomadura rudentiformis]|nr:aminotransferase class I/II-fold pyridoxal phosphate-dependent enzyme [Actinomadura rudentiformis]
MSGHMTPDEFRRYGKQVIDWIADYHEKIESYPVLSQVRPGEVAAGLPDHPPERGEGFDALLADLDRVIMPGITHWQHPGFFAYFPSNVSGPAILGDLLSAGIGIQGMLWATSPACTELETRVLDWLAELLDLPARFRSDGGGRDGGGRDGGGRDGGGAVGGGVIQDSASSACLVAILAALERAGGGAAARAGIARRYTLYVSSQTHSSLEKAARITGIGAANVRVVDVDPVTLAMDPAHLDALLTEDTAAGAVPVLVCATVGTTSTTAIDPVPEIGAVCRDHGVWLHVDAAYAGAAAVCPEFRWINAGMEEYADSYATNPHKWLLTNFDCTALWVADRQPLIGALSILPEYLRNTATTSGEVIDYRDWQISLGRRFRALKLWSVIRWYGAEGLREHIRTGVGLARDLAGWIRDDPDFELFEDPTFGLVCFRPRWEGLPDEEADAATLSLMERLNASGDLYLTHTKARGRVLLRLAVGGPATVDRHVRTAWERVRQEAGQVPVGR